MNFQLSETQSLLAETVSAVVADHVESQGNSPSKHGLDGSPLWDRLAGLGLLGAEIDEAYGENSGAFEDLAVILQGLGRRMF